MELERYETRLRQQSGFVREQVPYGNLPQNTECAVINLYDEVTYQQLLGFGGAFTESAAYVYAQMDAETKRAFCTAYFDREAGIGYNFGRTHINSCDFSLDLYTSVTEGDRTLQSFGLAREQRYVLPFLKDVLASCPEELVLFASPWSPPAYMKENESMIGGGRLKEDCKPLWAAYYAKYIHAMANEGVNISAISVQNEPMARQTWESCEYTAQEEAEFLKRYLIPALDAEGLSDVRIIIWDHNKERVYDRARDTLADPAVASRVWAVGHHWYTGAHYDGLSLVHEQLHKPVLCTEFCGSIEADPAVVAERYAVEMCENLAHYDIASCDWNLLLNQNGGPFHNRTADSVAQPGVVHDVVKGGCLAPILYDTRQKTMTLTPIYYAIGHFSKWLRRGATRIAATTYSEQLHVCAFRNPDGRLAAVVVNTADHALPAVFRLRGVCTSVSLSAHSVSTVLFPFRG